MILLHHSINHAEKSLFYNLMEGIITVFLIRHHKDCHSTIITQSTIITHRRFYTIIIIDKVIGQVLI